jgi:putative glutamine amidotransferase
VSHAPIIGITSYVEPATRGDWVDVPSALIPHAYVRKVEEAGGLALLIPPRLDSAADDHRLVRTLLGRLDGIIIAGGADVAPELYEAERHPSVQASRPDRDTTELAIARVSAELDLPVLGICRGMQVMAVAAGGELEQHVPERVGHDDHSPAPATYGSHPVEMVPGSILADLLGARLDVPSYHHQAVTTHPGYSPAAWASDGTLEAMEDPSASFRVAVQWHPEQGDDPRLFEALVAAAMSYAAGLGRARP